LVERRRETNRRFVDKYRAFLEDEDERLDAFFTPEEETLLCRIVSDTGIRFGDEFRPHMWPSVRWTAFAYFKRFYLDESTMEYFPKNVMMTCYWLASKVDEFNVSIDQFVENLKTGSREGNVDIILTLEPELLEKLRYQPTIHTPYRPFEGLMIEAKTVGTLIMKAGFDLESIRPKAMDFFTKALVGDAMLLFPPSQLALAAIKHGMDSMTCPPTWLRDFLVRMTLRGGDQVAAEDSAEKVLAKVELICRTVEELYAQDQAPDMQKQELRVKLALMQETKMKLDAELRPQRPGGGQEPVDSDDEEYC